MDSPATPPAAAGAPLNAGETGEKWEIAEQWRLAWRTLKWSAAGLGLVVAMMAIGQLYLFHQLFSDIHPALGWGFVIAITGLLTWLIGLPLLRFFHIPAIVHAPDVDLRSKTIQRADLLRRIDYDSAYLKGMAANPALADQRAAALKAREDLTILKVSIRDKPPADLAGALAEFERSRIAVLLSELDKKVDDYIHKEAIAVGSATAISLNGSIDAFVVLWRNINMVSRIARLYYGRPSLRLSLMILRDVMVAVLLSRALDDVTDAAGDALGKIITRLGGMVVGPVMDGSVNALMTLKLGYLARKRCRSFDVWSKASAARAVTDVFDQVKRESSNLIGELVKAVGGVAGVAGGVVGAAANAAGSVAGAATGAAGKVLAVPKSAWGMVQDAFVKKSAKEES